MFFTFLFVSRVLLYFSLSKAASCSRYTHCHSSRFEILSNLDSEDSPHYYGAYQLISLLNLPNSATNILYHSSLARIFSSVQSWSTSCDKTMVFFKLISLIAPFYSLSNFSLIMAKSLWSNGSIWVVDCGFGPLANYDSVLGLQIYILLFFRVLFIYVEFL